MRQAGIHVTAAERCRDLAAVDVSGSAVQEGALLVASPKLEPCSVSAPPGVLLASSTRQQGVRGADHRASPGADRRPPRKLKQVCVALDPQAGLPSVPAPADVVLPANREEITVCRSWQDAATRDSSFIHQAGCSAHIGHIRENSSVPVLVLSQGVLPRVGHDGHNRRNSPRR
ncbi:uncharacterized protein [Dermacentor andersoni]|uniref:uncharacterized protein isoform X4 n=1 Tax=Dermacentor andersoni TaxID=34620 RepID=UPI003B3AE8A4